MGNEGPDAWEDRGIGIERVHPRCHQSGFLVHLHSISVESVDAVVVVAIYLTNSKIAVNPPLSLMSSLRLSTSHLLDDEIHVPYGGFEVDVIWQNAGPKHLHRGDENVKRLIGRGGSFVRGDR